MILMGMRKWLKHPLFWLCFGGILGELTCAVFAYGDSPSHIGGSVKRWFIGSTEVTGRIETVQAGSSSTIDGSVLTIVGTGGGGSTNDASLVGPGSFTTSMYDCDAGAPCLRSLGSGNGQAMAGNDPRLGTACDGGAACLRAIGTGSGQVAAGNDSRLSDSRAPNGTAAGSLAGTYPNPTIAAGAIGTPELAAQAVTHAKLADGSVSPGNLDPGLYDCDGSTGCLFTGTERLKLQAATSPNVGGCGHTRAVGEDASVDNTRGTCSFEATDATTVEYVDDSTGNKAHYKVVVTTSPAGDIPVGGSRKVVATPPLFCGGDASCALSAGDPPLTIAAASASAPGSMSAADFAKVAAHDISRRDTLQTTNGTAQTLYTVTLANNAAHWIQVECLAIQSDTDAMAGYGRDDGFRNSANTVVQITGGAASLPTTDKEDNAAWGGVGFTVSGATYTVTVQGVASQTINWVCTTTGQAYP